MTDNQPANSELQDLKSQVNAFAEKHGYQRREIFGRTINVELGGIPKKADSDGNMTESKKAAAETSQDQASSANIQNVYSENFLSKPVQKSNFAPVPASLQNSFLNKLLADSPKSKSKNYAPGKA